jgi:hypothetical protein
MRGPTIVTAATRKKREGRPRIDATSNVCKVTTSGKTPPTR